MMRMVPAEPSTATSTESDVSIVVRGLPQGASLPFQRLFRTPVLVAPEHLSRLMSSMASVEGCGFCQLAESMGIGQAEVDAALEAARKEMQRESAI